MPRRARSRQHANTRLDAALVERGLMTSRARAQASILAGEVYVAGVRASKPGQLVGGDTPLEVRARRPIFVSRGGEKLAHALTTLAVDVTGVRAVDVGASTGGFTDCLLQRGARKVYAIDVGTGQLAWRLRQDPRVVSLERRDVRKVTVDDLQEPVDLATVDVAFISLVKVLPAVARLVRPGGDILALVKPQFEVGPKRAPGGVVSDAAVHRAVLQATVDAVKAMGLSAVAATHSPLAGPEGNLEFFLHLRNAPERLARIDVDGVVAAAHARVVGRGRGARPASRAQGGPLAVSR